MSEKKWKQTEVEEKILERLMFGEATKYGLGKEMPRIPFATLLNATRKLKEKGLIEYRQGKRRAHITRLTLKGLLYLLRMKGWLSKKDLELAKIAFLRMLRERGFGQDEVARALGGMSEKALSFYIKQYLMRLVFKLEDVDIEEIVKELREEGPPYHPYSLKNVSGVVNWCMWRATSRFSPLMKEIVFPGPQMPFFYFPECEKDEVEEFVKFIAKRDDVIRTFYMDYAESSFSSIIGKPWRIRRWLMLGCVWLCFEFDIKDVHELVRSLKKVKDDGIVEGDLNKIFDLKVVEVAEMIPCPVNRECELRELDQILSCENYPKALQLTKEVLIGSP